MSKDSEVIAHRSFVFDSFSLPVTRFYSILEAMISMRAIPGAKVSRILLPEGGFLSAKREYLRVRRGAEVFDICAASVGEQFIVSHWLRRIPRHRAWIKWLVGFFLLLPFVQFVSESLNEKITGCCAMALVPFFFLGAMLWFFRLIPGVGLFFNVTRALFGWSWKHLQLPTIFQSDAASLFRSTIPSVVEEALQAIRAGQGLLGAAEGEVSSAATSA